MPDAPGLELIAAEINAEHPGAVIETSFDFEQAALIIDSEQVLAVLSWLRDSPEQSYTFLSSLHCADYLPAEPRFGIHYELLNCDRVERLRVKALLADPAAASAGGADFGGAPRNAGVAGVVPKSVTGPAGRTHHLSSSTTSASTTSSSSASPSPPALSPFDDAACSWEAAS